MGYTVIIAAALLLVCRVHSQDALDICNPLQIDECGVKLYERMMDPSKIPVGESELNSYCDGLKNGQQCVNTKLEACPTLIPAEIAKGYVQALTYSVDDVCKPGGSELGKKILEHTPCVKEKLSGFSCTKDFLNKLEGALLEEKKEQMPLACCAFSQFDKCYKDEVKDKCGKAASRSIRSIIQGFGLFLVDRCLPYLADPGQCSDRVPKALPAGTRTVKSILPSLAEIISNAEAP